MNHHSEKIVKMNSSNFENYITYVTFLGLTTSMIGLYANKKLSSGQDVSNTSYTSRYKAIKSKSKSKSKSRGKSRSNMRSKSKSRRRNVDENEENDDDDYEYIDEEIEYKV